VYSLSHESHGNLKITRFMSKSAAFLLIMFTMAMDFMTMHDHYDGILLHDVYDGLLICLLSNHPSTLMRICFRL